MRPSQLRQELSIPGPPGQAQAAPAGILQEYGNEGGWPKRIFMTAASYKGSQGGDGHPGILTHNQTKENCRIYDETTRPEVLEQMAVYFQPYSINLFRNVLPYLRKSWKYGS